ncbi:hypothetical protein CYLTODRAFT_492287 [Cylindrobasidium torrendii FP15055 ss-10]|uniref:Uncharacterized protein n=1 Tax=Cylindrobasidium torrendii FP15055 ss-10 TaxID=1314674 RepID=A0A0D7B4R5_9AGAR|nr:hypothetical protein CYLTODRAFT_492287 [Cylindrobasidium torrendii FP15055 ss-10]
MEPPDWDALANRFRIVCLRNAVDQVDEGVLRELWDELEDLLSYQLLPDGTPRLAMGSQFSEKIPFMHINQDIIRHKLQRIGGKSIEDIPSKRKANSDPASVVPAKRPRNGSPIPQSPHSDSPPSVPGSSRTTPTHLPTNTMPVHSPSPQHVASITSPSNGPRSLMSPPGPPVSTNLTDLLLQQTAGLRKLQQDYNESVKRVQTAQEAHARLSYMMAEARRQVNQTATRLRDEVAGDLGP